MVMITFEKQSIKINHLDSVDFNYFFKIVEQNFSKQGYFYKVFSGISLEAFWFYSY